jgi:beta-lactamase class A
LTRKQEFFYAVFMPFFKKFFTISLISSLLFLQNPSISARAEDNQPQDKKQTVKSPKKDAKKKTKNKVKKKKRKKEASTPKKKPKEPPRVTQPLIEEKERPVEGPARTVLTTEGLPLQALVEQEVSHLKALNRLLPADEISLQIYDLEGKRLLADLNGNIIRNSASLIKPFVMLAVFDQVARHELQETPELERSLYRMIAISDNRATNQLILRLGRGDATQGIIAVNVLLQKTGFQSTRLRELIPEGGKTYANQTTVSDTTVFFKLLYEQKLISPQYSQKMNDILLKNVHDRIRTALIKKDGIAVADKTGYVRGLNGDCGIVYQGGVHKGCDYVLSVIIENKNKPAEVSWGRKKSAVIRHLSDRIYQTLKTGYTQSETKPRQIGLKAF